jgi:Protein of unknown function (DUF2934)
MDPNITAEEIHKLIRERARELREAEGNPDGKHQEHWLTAQKEVMAEVDQSGATGPVDPVARQPRSDNPNKRQEELVDEAIEESSQQAIRFLQSALPSLAAVPLIWEGGFFSFGFTANAINALHRSADGLEVPGRQAPILWFTPEIANALHVGSAET